MPGNVPIQGSTIDKLMLADGSGRYTGNISFNKSTLVFGDTDMGQAAPPSPKSDFPFPRVTSTIVANGTGTCLYHQISDSILAEENWDGTSGTWISKNIMIDTSGG